MSGSNQVRAGPIEKSQKSDHASGFGDYISSLPHCIIASILSLLPLKDVVRTSILSNDWKEIWMSIYNLDINVMELFGRPSKDNEKNFVNFVKKMIAHDHKLRSFRIDFSGCEEYCPSDFNDWTSAALRRKVENLQIVFCYDDLDGCHYEECILYCSLQNCGSLRILKVVMPYLFRIVNHDCFANLVRLELLYVTLISEHNSNTLIFNFPVLREIELEKCEWSMMKVVEMHAPLLSKFKSAVQYRSIKYDDYMIKIVGSKLEKFATSVGPPENIVFDGSTVVYAYICCYKPWRDEFQECGFQIRKLLRELPQVKDMVLMGFLEAIAKTKQGPSLKKFTDLEKLHVCPPIDVEGLLELLHATPNLKFLEICMRDGYELYDDVEISDDYDYDGIEDIPSCLTSHLQEVKLNYSRCEKPNFELAKFLLKNGVELKYFEVCGSPNFPTNEILDVLLAFPKSSTCLTIEGYTCPSFFGVL